MLTRRVLMAGAGAALSPARAAAQDQTVRIVAGFPAGGGIDISARLLVDPFKEALGLPTIVENRSRRGRHDRGQRRRQGRRRTAA